MAESIRKSLNKLTQSIKSNTSQKSQNTILSSYKSKPKNELETLINTPINSIVNTKSFVKPSLSQKAATVASNTIQTASSIFTFRNILFIILLIILLSFLGLNIFTYLSDGTNFLTNLFGPIISSTGEITGNTSKNVVSNASTGTQQIIQTGSDTAKNIVDVASTGTTSSIGFLQDKLKKNTSIVNPENSNKKIDKIDSQPQPEPVTTQALQQGYCFIGKINDTRNCAKVNQRQQCMSGDIYPTMDICVNPNLRL